GVRDQVVAAVERTVTEFGSADILVNNAWGGGGVARLEHKTDAAMEHGLRVGLLSAFWAMQAAFPHMRAAGWGRSVSVCSVAAADDARYVSGNTLFVDGGGHINGVSWAPILPD